VKDVSKKHPPIKEKDFQAQVIQLARLRGWRVAHFRPGRTLHGGWYTAVSADGVGFPDLVCVRERDGAVCIIFAELKMDGRSLTDEQEAWADLLSKATHNVEYHVWRPSDWKEIENTLAPRERPRV
jgi:hypothetical protein